MMEKNKMENIREEIERASQTMSAATFLFDNNLINDAVSRLYYFLLYNNKGTSSNQRDGTKKP